MNRTGNPESRCPQHDDAVAVGGGVAARRRAGGAADDQTWDEWYAEQEQVWSGNANDALVHEVGGLSPGRALDVGCGEGGDAVWLAGQGWQVTAVDVSRVALDRAAASAAQAGVGDLIDWQRHDLGTSFPEGSYDLVSAQFLHSRGELAREEILRRAAEAVAPGGVLLIESHLGFPSWEHDQHDGHGSHEGMHFPTPEEVVEELRLPDGEWEVLRCAAHERVQNDPEGRPTIRTDSTVKLRRLSRLRQP